MSAEGKKALLTGGDGGGAGPLGPPPDPGPPARRARRVNFTAPGVILALPAPLAIGPGSREVRSGQRHFPPDVFCGRSHHITRDGDRKNLHHITRDGFQRPGPDRETSIAPIVSQVGDLAV